MSGESALLVDLGNSRLKWALLTNGRLGPATAATHGVAGVAAAVEAEWARLPRPGRVLVGSVSGTELDDAIRAQCRRLWSLEPRFVAATARAAGVTSGYDSPDRLGVDRWLALLATRADGRGAACVVDCGTAVTVDVIDGEGRHHGGVIIPGLQAMRECLLSRTRIPPFAPSEPRSELGRETAAAVANGSLLAIVGAVRETRKLAQQLLGRPTRLILAGGAGDLLAAAIDEPSERRPDLVLEGLAVLAGTEDA